MDSFILGSEKMKFGQNIKQIRKRMNMSQKELATKMEISQSYLSDIESGRKNLSIKTVKKLADSLGLSVTDLFNDDTTF